MKAQVSLGFRALLSYSSTHSLLAWDHGYSSTFAMVLDTLKHCLPSIQVEIIKKISCLLFLAELRNVANSHSTQPSNEGDTIKVFVRIRPPAEGTGSVDGEHSLCLSVLSQTTLRLHSKPDPKTFVFDYVAGMDTTQESVFSTVAKSIVESCMSGYNGTIFAYGQTGSGKTFTMMGPSDSDNFSQNLRGVIPRSFEYLFSLIDREKEKAGAGKTFLCKCSFTEVYNEQIYDLLDPASVGLYLREHIRKGVFVVGAVEQAVASAAEAYQVLSRGWRNRRVASTSMNRESSRSHAVFTITVESMEKSSETVNIRTSLLNLVDLAGSERQKDTHAEGARLKEAGNINRSLSCLGQVITALVDVGNGKQRHICYRDSKLTFLLRDSLGGNAKTSIIANVHPGSRCFGETLSTLNFAQRAKLIKNKAVVNEDTQGNVSQLQAEVKRLKEQLFQFTSGQIIPESLLDRDKEKTNYIEHFLEAMLFFKKSEQEKKSLVEKITQLENLTLKKEKFIQSNKMIVKFREDQIMRLERLQKEARGSFLPEEQDRLLSELRDEIQTLREQVEHHPRVAKYAIENHSLREENRRLKLLEPVKRAHEIDVQSIARLEKAFSEVSSKENNDKGLQGFSPKALKDPNFFTNTEKLKSQLLQIQTELNNSKQEYEEFKELTRKKQLELESELQSFQKANLNLEKLLEATKACKRQEVSQLNKIHAETLKEQLSALQVKLDEEVHKNLKLQQNFDKLEHHSAQMQEVFSSERSDWTKQQQDYLAQVNDLEKQLEDAQTKNDFLKCEVHDLRIVLHSADKELSLTKLEYSTFKENQEKELSQLSERHVQVQVQLDNTRLENEKLLKSQACIQDSYDNLQEVMKFEIDQLSKQLQSCKQENETLKSDLHNLMELFDAEKERNNKLSLQFEEDKENSSKEILKVLEAVRQEKQKEMAKCEQQMAKVQKLEESLLATENVISSLEKSRDSDKELVTNLMNQIQELRTSAGEKAETIDTLKQELQDINCKYNVAMADKEESRELIRKQEVDILELKETLRLRILSEDIERDMLCEDLAHATEQLNMLTEASKKHSGLLQSAQEELTKKEALIQELQHELNQKKEEVEQRKSEYNFKMRQLEHVMDSATEYPQSPKTPPHFQPHLAKLLETQEQEIEDGRASKTFLQHLVTKLNEDREVKNAEILRIKDQLCEMENLRLESQQLRDQNWLLQSQLDEVKWQKDGGNQSHPDSQQLKNEYEEEIVKERLAKNKLIEEMLKMKTDPGCPGTHSVDQAGQNSEFCLPLPSAGIKALKVSSVDMEKKENMAAHHTSEFQTKNIVLRRGQIFNMKVILNRPLQPQDELKLIFSIGQNSSKYVELDPMTSFRSQGWHVKIAKQSGSEITLSVISAADAVVGQYSLYINSHDAGSFFLLFNPWCADDTVYLPSEEERAEYILNDTGYIYMGFAKQIKEKPWTFGQFEKSVLDCCMYLLSNLTPHELQSPVSVSRTICTMVCGEAGSTSRLLQVYRVNAVVVHQHLLSQFGVSCIQNFHVWTDAWMKRQDLPPGHDGWQVLDATPQEISEGGFRTGPSPLSAIRQGAVQIQYDTKFVFTEVNGDKFIWLVKQKEGKEKNVLIAVETASIGKNISTKMVGENKREDITLQYKFPEGSVQGFCQTGRPQTRTLVPSQDSPQRTTDLGPKGP
ncbi:kinesin-like protein KIF15 [Cricetulus griseus]|uniref:Kinesin-like protein KIF15 n=1 Tax=Cricetulus griseus TaxID=10029 RepID=A0A061I2E3_CRIGR|nr:kinesin-like protein KIF15 [Cricetulus griseus]